MDEILEAISANPMRVAHRETNIVEIIAVINKISFRNWQATLRKNVDGERIAHEWMEKGKEWSTGIHLMIYLHLNEKN